MEISITEPSDIAKLSKQERNIAAQQSNPLQAAFCAPLGGIARSIGCDVEQRAGFLDGFCGMLNGLLNAFGCEPPDEGEDYECWTDDDCGETETCQDHECITDPNDCRNDPDVCELWEDCNTDTGQCEADEDHCHYTDDCESWEFCDDESGECEPEDEKCNTDDDCPWPSTPEEDVCNVEDHKCVECVEWQDCDPEGGYECTDDICVGCGGGIGDNCNDDGDCCDYLYCDMDKHTCV